MSESLDALFEKSLDSLAASLDRVVQKALSDYDVLKKAEQKGELSHIYISFLLSSVLCKLPWLRIDLYDENDRNDMTECYIDWDVSNISDRLYCDANAIAKQNNAMKDYELEQIWVDISGTYFQTLERLMPAVISKCPAAEKESCEWRFGQYLGSTVTVREKSKDEVF